MYPVFPLLFWKWHKAITQKLVLWSNSILLSKLPHQLVPLVFVWPIPLQIFSIHVTVQFFFNALTVPPLTLCLAACLHRLFSDSRVLGILGYSWKYISHLFPPHITPTLQPLVLLSISLPSSLLSLHHWKHSSHLPYKYFKTFSSLNSYFLKVFSSKALPSLFFLANSFLISATSTTPSTGHHPGQSNMFD